MFVKLLFKSHKNKLLRVLTLGSPCEGLAAIKNSIATFTHSTKHKFLYPCHHKFITYNDEDFMIFETKLSFED